MGARILAMMIGKGGSGKTTTTNNLGAALAMMGNRVCLIDIDPQGGLTRSLGINPKHLSKEQTIYWALIGQTSLASILVQPENSAVHLAPSNLHLVGCDRDLPEDGQTLKAVLAQAAPFYNYILVDCPPNLGILTVNASVAADAILIPVQCEFLAYEAVGDAVLLIQELRPDLPYYVFPTMVKRTKLSDDIVAGLEQTYNGHTLSTKIKHTVRFGDASMAGVSMFQFSRNSEPAYQYKELAYEVVGTIFGEEGA